MKLWGRTWSNISHAFLLNNAVGILLYCGKTSAPEVLLIKCQNSSKAARVYHGLERCKQRMGYPINMLPFDLMSQLQSMTDDDNNDENDLKILRIIDDSSMESYVFRTDSIRDETDIVYADEIMQKLNKRMEVICRGGVSITGEIDGYRFGTANGKKSMSITGPESDVLIRGENSISTGFDSWAELDKKIWLIIWEWRCTHSGMNTSRCNCTIIINRSDCPIQVSKIHLEHGKNVTIWGSEITGYEMESRSIMPDGCAVIFSWAFSPSPMEVGHIRTRILSVAFDLKIASTLKESHCESKGGFSVGFLEKSVEDSWSKFTVVVV